MSDESVDRYEALRKLIMSAPPMTPEQQEEQRLDFAYGNLACSTNHKPSRAAFWKVAHERGWTQERFDSWAHGREWLP